MAKWRRHARNSGEVGQEGALAEQGPKAGAGSAIPLLLPEGGLAAPVGRFMRNRHLSGGTSLARPPLDDFALTSFDPLLEKQIGFRVMVELAQEGGGTRLLRGVLKEYSKELLEIMDVPYTRNFFVSVPGTPGNAELEGLAMTRGESDDAPLHVENENPFDVNIDRLEAEPEGGATSCGKVLRPHESIDIQVPAVGGSLKLCCETHRRGDLLMPRATAFVRHRSEPATVQVNGEET